MAEIDNDKIKQNAKELKNNTYGKNMADKAKGYTTGAVVGGIAGFVAGYYFKVNMPLCIVVGIVGGGWMGYTIAESNQMKQEFNFKRP